MSVQEQEDERESDLWQEWKMCCHHSAGRTWDFVEDGVQWPNQKQDFNLLTGWKICSHELEVNAFEKRRQSEWILKRMYFETTRSKIHSLWRLFSKAFTFSS